MMKPNITISSKLVNTNSCTSVCFIILYTFTLFHCHQSTDKTTLLAIKAEITDDPFRITSSWSSNNTHHFCNWHGVTCNRRHQRVTKLDLRSSKLKGTLSPYIGNLSFLTELHIQNNSFKGTIPPEIGRLQRLELLWLNKNSFVGEIPLNLSRCTTLVELMLNNNNLVGRIPPELGSLSTLRWLYLRENHLTGTIPSSLGNLTSLVELALLENHLIGKIPDSLGSLRSIDFISLHNNNLSGVVPTSIFNLSSLTDLELSQNRFEGTLPTNLGTMLPKIRYFIIADNRFVGSLPVSLFNSSNLELLTVCENNFQGHVPSLGNAKKLRSFIIYGNLFGSGKLSDLNFVSSFGNDTKLEEFQIQLNKFSGNFPKTLCNFSMISFLSLAHNKITGTIPSCIENLAYLQTFDTRNNLIFGAIPSSIGKLQNIGRLGLANNQLSGNIPTTIGNMTQLSILFLRNNHLQGKIPPTLGNCSNLQALDLSSNYLSGRIPFHIFRLSTLSIVLDISHNYLSGSIPTEVGKLINVNELYFSENKLSGDIPSTLSACSSLQGLYMDGNDFHGSIPSALVTLKGLVLLDLSRNNLSGKIPKFLGDLKLEQLNLSHNNFVGEVPTNGVFAHSDNFSILGNKELCGGIPELKLHECDSNKTLKRRTNHGRKLTYLIVFGVFGVILLVVFLSLYTILNKKRRQAPSQTCDLESSLTTLSYQTLLKATNGFSSQNIIGHGTFGVVYKGILDDDKTVAIKKFKLERKAAFKSFIAECGALQNIRHRNLVKVITACSSVDHQGNDFKALVFEYMENGSLQDWLESNPMINANNAPKNLTIFHRFDIAIDIAFALEYLHHRCGTPIVHCDLKPSNVLLDNEMTARVADFGLAKFLSRSDSFVPHENLSDSSTIGIRGTVGYTPPEYGMGNEVSTQGDVYSFGILLLELFTGKKPVNDMFTKDLSLYKYVKEALPNRVIDILDHRLLTDLTGDEAVMDTTTRAQSLINITSNSGMIMMEALISILEISVACSHETPQERLDMSDVVTKLISTKNKLIGIHSQPQRNHPMSRTTT